MGCTEGSKRSPAKFLLEHFGKNKPDLRKVAEIPGLLPFNLLGGLAAGAQGMGEAAGSTGKMLKDVGEGVRYFHSQATENIGRPAANALGLDPISAPALGL